MNKTKLYLHILEKIKKLKTRKDKGWQRLKAKSLFQVLKASDGVLMNAYQAASGQPVTDLDTEGGTIELGPFLYYMNHPPFELVLLNKLVVEAMELAEDRKLPASRFTPESYKAMLKLAKTQGIVGKGGEIYGDGKYEQLDPGWIFSLFMFVIYELGIEEYHPFGDSPAIVTAPADKPLKIAVVGDWGTGKFGKYGGPAKAVIDGIKNQYPDYVIHLGDVYYAGTDHEEKHNLLALWPASFGADRSFTLNSNHEMYDGANGYFDKALHKGGPFNAQQQTSYFAIRHGDWLFIGLDSAYFSDPHKLFMNGNIGGSDGAQADWIRNNFKDQDPAKVVVFTHHTPVNLAGDALNDPDNPEGLWNEVVAALGNKAPGSWYFGHTHNAAVYTDASAIGRAGCNGRLAGHGAIPYGESVTLQKSLDSGLIKYFPKTHLPNGDIRVRNGFATIEIGASGKMTEKFYEIDDGSSDAKQVWP
jgi:hypothetical protein